MSANLSKTKRKDPATINDVLLDGTARLKSAGIPTARLDCLVLLEDVMGADRSLLLAHPDRPVTSAQAIVLNKLVIQREKHVPLAYIRGRNEFYGRNFLVNRHVLVPRPETENLVELLKSLPLPDRPKVADIGTGSGCIGITAALEVPGSQVDLYDIDPAALDVARQNAAVLNASVEYLVNDLLTDVTTYYDCLLANLPYVPEGFPINDEAAHEPKRAIFAGGDGLDAYRRFWLQAAALPRRAMHVITESLPCQHELIARLAQSAGYHLADTSGLAQRFDLDAAGANDLLGQRAERRVEREAFSIAPNR